MRLFSKAETSDQAAELRRLAQTGAAEWSAPANDDAAGPQLSIAITSGKGGVGKTNIAVNLAVCLQTRGLQTTLVDLDVGLANADVLMDVRPQRNLRDVVAGRCTPEEARVPGVNGLAFIGGVSGGHSGDRLNSIERARLADRLARLPGDVVIFDCAAGIGESVMTFARAADVVLVVTTPEPPALADAYATVKTLKREGYGSSVRLLVNMVESRPEAKNAYNRIREVCEKFINFPIADAGYMLHDTHVELAVRQRTPFVVRYPGSSAAICMAAIAARLVSGGALRQRPQGLLRRVVGMFA